MTAPPEWVEVAGIALWSAAMTVAVFWQPKWMHRWWVQIARRGKKKAEK